MLENSVIGTCLKPQHAFRSLENCAGILTFGHLEILQVTAFDTFVFFVGFTHVLPLLGKCQFKWGMMVSNDDPQGTRQILSRNEQHLGNKIPSQERNNCLRQL